MNFMSNDMDIKKINYCHLKKMNVKILFKNFFKIIFTF